MTVSFQRRARRARAVFALLAFLVLCTTAVAAPDPELPRSGTYALAPAPLVELVALRNAEALSSELQTRVAEGLLESERALYEPVLFSRSRREEVDRPRNLDDPLQSPFFGSQAGLEEQIIALTFGGRRLLSTGAEVQGQYQVIERRSSALQGQQEYSGDALISLRQPVLRGRGRGATEADLRVVELERDIDVLRYRSTMLEAAGEAVNAYWQLYRALEGLEIRRASLDTVGQLLEDVERRAEGGFAPRTDLLEARIEVASRRADVTRAERLVDEAQGRLRSLLNLENADADALRFRPVVEPDLEVPPMTLSGRIEAARERWPDVRIAEKRLRQEAIRLGLAENELMPVLDLELGLRWNSIGSDAGGDAVSGLFSPFTPFRQDHRNGYYAAVEFEMPIGNRAAEGRVEAQSVRVQQARLTLGAAVNRLGQDVATRYRQLLAAGEEVEQLREDARLREQLLAAERAQYGLGQARLAQVFDREEELNESRQRLVDVITRFELARLALLLADGSLLDEFGVRLRVVEDEGMPVQGAAIR